MRDRSSVVTLYVDREPTAAEVRQNNTQCLYEPGWGCFIGAYIDQDSGLERVYKDQVDRLHRYPEDFERRVGKSHATYFFYMGYGMPLATDWIGKLGTQGKIVHIALEPNLGLEEVRDDDYLRTLADSLHQSGQRIFLRFASEMNGDWTAYGCKPALYREKFRLVSSVMKERAPNVAMVWCPYASPTKNIPSFYPGDSYVDWVGVNLYSVTYFNQDRSKPAWSVHPCDMLEPVYSRYSTTKPIMIAEFGATHYSAVEHEQKTDYAVRCIRALYQALPRLYPRVKAINYFDANNMEIEHAKNNDYSLTSDRQVQSTYTKTVADPYYLSSPDLDALPPQSPMPLAPFQTLRGRINLSAWVKSAGDGASVRFLLDGKEVFRSTQMGDWSTVLDLTNETPRIALLTAEAYAGKVLIGRTQATIQIAK